MKTKTKKSKNNEEVISYQERIEEIKSRISSIGSQRVCTAEVYEVWQNIFEPDA